MVRRFARVQVVMRKHAIIPFRRGSCISRKGDGTAPLLWCRKRTPWLKSNRGVVVSKATITPNNPRERKTADLSSYWSRRVVCYTTVLDIDSDHWKTCCTSKAFTLEPYGTLVMFVTSYYMISRAPQGELERKLGIPLNYRETLEGL